MHVASSAVAPPAIYESHLKLNRAQEKLCNVEKISSGLPPDFESSPSHLASSMHFLSAESRLSWGQRKIREYEEAHGHELDR